MPGSVSVRDKSGNSLYRNADEYLNKEEENNIIISVPIESLQAGIQKSDSKISAPF